MGMCPHTADVVTCDDETLGLSGLREPVIDLMPPAVNFGGGVGVFLCEVLGQRIDLLA